MDNKFTVVTPFGEVLRKREIIYTISGEDPRLKGYEMITDINGELALRKNGIVYAVGESGLSIGGASISRRLGAYQQKDLGEGSEEIESGVFLLADKNIKKEKSYFILI